MRTLPSRFSLLLGLIALCGHSLDTARAADEPCQIVRAASLTMTVDEGGTPNVPMSIGTHTVNLLVDTGGTYSMLSSATVETLGMPKLIADSAPFILFGGHKLDQFTIARDVNLGGLKAPRMLFLVMPYALPQGVDGSLSNDVLRAYDVEFD